MDASFPRPIRLAHSAAGVYRCVLCEEDADLLQSPDPRSVRSSFYTVVAPSLTPPRPVLSARVSPPPPPMSLENQGFPHFQSAVTRSDGEAFSSLALCVETSSRSPDSGSRETALLELLTSHPIDEGLRQHELYTPPCSRLAESSVFFRGPFKQRWRQRNASHGARSYCFLSHSSSADHSFIPGARCDTISLLFFF